MAINKKLIHFLKKADFDTLLAAGNILDTSIVFIKDAKQIYTHGQLYNCPFTEDEIRSLLNNKADLSKLNDYLTKTDAAAIYLLKGNYITSIPTANGTTAGIVKQGGDVTISNGVITVNDDSHNHIISNVDGLQSALDAKQDIISDLSTIRSNASKGATALLSVPLASTTSLGGVKSGGDVTISSEGIMSVVDDSHNHIISNVDGLLSALDAKLGIISDLSTIRSGAALGATALQSVPTASTSTAGIVKVGSNISVSSGTISLSKANVTAALGYTPPTAYTNMTASEATTGTATTGRVISAKVLHDKINEMLPTTLSEAKSYTDTKVSELVGLAPDALDTIYELAEAMATNLGAVDTLEAAIGNKVDKVTGKGLSTNDYTTTEKNKLAGIASGAEVNVQSDWSVTDTTSDAYIKNKPSLAAVATSGKYSDLSGRPTVDSAISTSSTNAVQNKAITAAVNAKYTKPSTGIPSTDLSSDVLGSLAKADSALQSFTETDPVFTASAAASIKSSDISNWNSKTSNVGTITGIKMNGKSKGTSGVVDLGTVITAHQDISGKVDKVSGKGLSTNDYTDTEKSKLAGIASGAEVNQNAFSNVKVGDVTIAADAKQGTLTLVAGSNVTITPDATNDKITIAAKDTTYSFSNGNPTLAWGKQSTVGTVGGTALTVTMPSNPNSHYNTAIKAGESETNSNAAVSNPYIKVLDNTTYRSLIRLVGGGATTVSSDASGNITISSTNTTYGEATSSAAGLMSAADKSKLAGIAEGANKYSLPLAASGTRGGIQLGYSASGANVPVAVSSEKAYVALTKTAVTSALGYTPPTSNTTYSIATNGTSGLVKPWYNHTAASTGPTAGSDSTAVTVNSISTTSGRYYALEMDSNGRGFVNVPWSNTTYTSLKNPNSLTVQYNGTTSYSYDGSAAKTLNIKAGSNITVSGDSSGNITINGTPNTTYAAGKGLTLSSTTFNVGAGTGITVGDDTISVKYGTTAGTAAQGNDSRLSDARNPKTNTLSSEDLNNITTPGFYAGGGNNTVTNKPSGVDAFGLIVFKTADGYITQELIEGNTNAGCRWTRQYTGSSWSSWIPMPTFSIAPTSGQVVITEGTTGKVKSSGYTIAKSVPSNAVFTDTHYTSKNIVGASNTATANATASNGSVYLNHLELSSVKSAHLIKGTGATTVTSDSSGNITINSTDTNTHYTTGLYVGASGAKSNATTSNGSTYLKLYDDSTSRASFKITGTGATTVSSDANGNITINSPSITKVSQLENDVPYAVDDVPSNGVYAVTAEGELIDYNNADSSCVGVALVAGEHKFMIAKSDATDGSNSTLYWGKNLYGKNVAGVVDNSKSDGTNGYGYLPKPDGSYQSTPNLSGDFTKWTAGALAEFDGAANTAAIIAGYTEHGVSMDARDMCTVLNTFNASDSYNDWYVPACGLLALINLNKTEINAALTKIGGTALTEYYYWSSSERDSGVAWYISLSHNYVGNSNKNNRYCVRFIRDISVLSLKERVSKLESEIASKANVEIKISNGVYAVLPNGLLVSYYEADESCIGVVAVEDDFKIMVYKYEVGQPFLWGAVEDYTLDNYDTLFEDKYFTKFGDGEISLDYKQWTSGALSDFKGKENTKMLNIPSITPLHMINLANRANLPDEPGFNNLGYLDWYIPSMGQLAYLYKNVEVANMLRKIGGDAFSELWGYWSSTERSADTAWHVEFQMGYVRADYKNKNSTLYVRLIRDYNPPTVIETLENKIYSNVYSKEEIDGMLAISKLEFVDLGLPSGLKWATCNVGAENPEEAGLYFAWGETKGYSGITGDKIFNFSDYKLCNGTIEPLIFTKYNTDSSFGAVDNKLVLEKIDDAAYQNDKTCRMPTVEDFNELMANTTSVLETLNGVNGRRFTSKTNGNSVFIPSAGHCYNGSVDYVDTVGFYWSSSLWDPINVLTFCFNEYVLMDICFRWQGQSVRAVQEPNSPSEIASKVSNKADKIFVIDHGTEDTTFTLTPNTYHKWGTVTSLTLTLGTLSDTSAYNEYMFEFISGTTATTLSLPSTISWASEPNIEAGKTYQVSILNNCGIIGGF